MFDIFLILLVIFILTDIEWLYFTTWDISPTILVSLLPLATCEHLSPFGGKIQGGSGGGKCGYVDEGGTSFSLYVAATGRIMFTLSK